MKNIALLGATGSIGSSTLAVVDAHPDKFNIFAISADKNWQKMQTLCQKYQPDYAVMVDETAAFSLKNALAQRTKKSTQNFTENPTEVLSGTRALCQIAEHANTDYVMAAIVGVAGMPSTLAAAKAGKRILLANKESLVLAGELLIKTVATHNAELIPVDSEHSAIFQCLQAGKSGLDGIQLTASGGPFLNTPTAQLAHITPEQACNHPNWTMGKKISVDSATMINKGLEVIEAHYLFALSAAQIKVVIHPQSIVHSSVYYADGSVLAQLGKPDMRTAISYALAYPNRIQSGVGALDLSQHSPLEFYPPDLDKFRGLKLAFDALKSGSGAMGALNAANEIAVAAFLQQRIPFLTIPLVIEKTLTKIQYGKLATLADLVAHDQNARTLAQRIIQSL